MKILKIRNMKTIFLKQVAILLLLAGNFCSCTNNYSNRIPPTEFCFDDTLCQWIYQMDYSEPLDKGEIILINSSRELKNYIRCDDGAYPIINFSKHSLLLVRGVTSSGHRIISKDIQQLSVYKYKVTVEIGLNVTGWLKPWSIAYIIPKSNRKNNIELSLTIN